MTAKRDLKRRVRLRQARTGEAYVTARRHVLAAREQGEDLESEAAQDPDPAAAAGGDGDGAESETTAAASDPAGAPVSVVELVDVSDEARRHGFLCRVVMFPALVRRVDVAHVLGRLHALLIETSSDPLALLLARTALSGLPPHRAMPALRSFLHIRGLIQRACAGMGGLAEDGSALAFHLAGREGIVPVLCTLSWHDALLVLQPADELTLADAALATSLGVARSLWRTLVVVHDGRSYRIWGDEFVIGRDARTVDLAIDDARVSGRHAAVIRRDGAHYLKDLGSADGITYRGMRIDNKRIDDGDVFEIGGHPIRFTFEREPEK